MKNNKLTKVVTSIVIAASMTMTMVPAVSAADYGTATYDTIDTTKTGSLTVHKYDITAATKAGVDTSVYNDDWKSDTKAETDLQKYSIPGVVFSYLKVADIYTESKTTANGIGVRVLYGFNDTNLIGDLGLDIASAELTKNSTYYYTSTEINDALKDKLENSNTATKNTLEDYIKANGGKDMTETSSTGVTSVDKLPVGLYMVVETYVPEDVTYTTDPFMVSIPSTTVDGQDWMYDINVYPKNQTDYPTLDKKVADDDDYSSEGNNGHALKDTASVSEGDIADYRITSKLPAIISKASYFTKYTFADTLAKGLTYNKDSVTLYWYDSKADADINDTAKAVATWTQDKNKFTVTVQDNKMTVAITEDGLSEINPNYAGKYVVVSYSTNVKSTDDLVLGDNGNANDVVLTYARTNTTYEDVLKDEAVVYSYGIDLTKTFSDNNGDATKVQFVAKNTSRLTDGQTATYYLVANKVSDGQYHVTGETTNADDATVFSPDNNGKINVYGLEENSYSLTEIATDKGYTLLKDDIKVDIKKTDATITASVASVRGQANPNANVIYTKNASASAKVDALNATMDSKADSTNALVKLSVENNKSFPIPPTGVMGTFVITLAGFAMMAVGLTYGKDKKKKEEA